MNYHILTLIIIILIASILYIPMETFQLYLAQPSKCYSCEKSLPDKLKYLGGPTKCFSCEKEIIKKLGSKYADLGQPTKCFSCESQYVNKKKLFNM